MSWLASRGRCRRCAHPIGLFYPFIELAAIVVVVWAATVFSDWILWVSCVLGWILLALALIDYKHYRLPDFLTLPLIPLGLVTAGVKDPMAFIDHIIGVVAGFAFVVILRAVYRRLRGLDGIGLGAEAPRRLRRLRVMAGASERDADCFTHGTGPRFGLGSSRCRSDYGRSVAIRHVLVLGNVDRLALRSADWWVTIKVAERGGRFLCGRKAISNQRQDALCLDRFRFSSGYFDVQMNLT